MGQLVLTCEHIKGVYLWQTKNGRLSGIYHTREEGSEIHWQDTIIDVHWQDSNNVLLIDGGGAALCPRIYHLQRKEET